MRSEIEKYELIERYLGGLLTEQELSDFEHRLKTDPEFASEVNRHIEISKLIHDGTLLKIRETVKEIHDAKSSWDFFKSLGGKILMITIAGLFILSTMFIIRKIRIQEEDHQTIESTFIENDTVAMYEHKEGTDKKENPKEHTEHVTHLEKPSEKQVDPPKESISDFSKSDISEEEKQIGTRVMSVVPPKETQLSEFEHEDEKGSAKATDSENVHISDSMDCHNVTISADVETKESCEQKPTGTIQIIKSSIQGGTPPYFVSIDNGENFYSSFVFSELPQGNYVVFIRDNHNCITNSGNYWIAIYDCNYEYVFAPDKGERWKAPNNGITGHIKIYSRQGKLVFSDRIDITESYFWDGNSSAYDPLSMGVYQFLLELDNNERIIGNITIVR